MDAVWGSTPWQGARETTCPKSSKPREIVFTLDTHSFTNERPVWRIIPTSVHQLLTKRMVGKSPLFIWSTRHYLLTTNYLLRTEFKTRLKVRPTKRAPAGWLNTQKGRHDVPDIEG